MSPGTPLPGLRLVTLLLPGNPGIWVLGFGAMAWWVLLMLVLAPWVPGVHTCLFCFGPAIQRSRLCHETTGAPVSDPRHRQCLEALVQAAVPLASVTVGESWNPRDTQPNGDPAQGAPS